MKSLDNLSDRIWSEMGRRRKAGRRIATATLGIFVFGIAGALLLWPNPAFGFQEVKEATLKFNTVRWTERDEGVIKSFGSDPPKRVPFFSTKREHFVSRDPLDVREKWDTWGEWRGLKSYLVPVKFRERGKIVTRMSPAHAYRKGLSTGVTKMDVMMAVGHFHSFASRTQAIEDGRLADTGKPAKYRGQDVFSFGSAYESKFGSSLQTWYADSKTRRLVFYQFEKFDAEHKRIFLRTVSDVRYDSPPPE